MNIRKKLIFSLFRYVNVVMLLVRTRLIKYSCFLVGKFYQQQLDLSVTSRVHQKFSDNMGSDPLRQPCVDFIFM